MNDKIKLGEQLLDELLSSKEKINNYILSCMNDIDPANELHRNFIVKLKDINFDDSLSKLNAVTRKEKKENIIVSTAIAKPAKQTTKFKFNCAKHKKITDEFFQNMHHLESIDLRCERCKYYCTWFDITDAAFCGDFNNLREFDCWNCINITDNAIKYLVNLTKLSCWDCNRITDMAFHNLTNLTELSCKFCTNITDAALRNLVNLTKLNCGYCPNITLTLENHDEFPHLEYLDCRGCVKITDIAFYKLPSLVELWCEECPDITLNSNYNELSRLRKLYCNFCPTITDAAISKLVGLVELHCKNCPNITYNSVKKLEKLAYLDIFAEK